jgi:competence protein ComEA
MLLMALVAMAGYWLVQGGATGRLVELRDAQRQTVTFQIDINRAQWPELTLLPDIGETLARRIVDSREKEGPFRSHDDLRRVRGIGAKTMEKLRPFLAPVGESVERNGTDATDGTDRTDGTETE